MNFPKPLENRVVKWYNKNNEYEYMVVGSVKVIYYYVSSYVSENQTLTRKTKNNRCFCEYVSNCSNEGYENYLNYYRELLSYQINEITGKDAAKWICEAVFDGIRKEYFPEKPSRIWGIYLSDSKKEATDFLYEYRDSKIAHIYEVEISERISGFDMSFYTEADERIRKERFSIASYELAVKLAKKYWSGTVRNKIDEYIVDSDITIGRCIL